MNRLYALKKVKNQLKNICNDNYDNATEYNSIRNICSEFEDNFGYDLHLCDYIDEQEVITEDDVIEDLLSQNNDSLTRLRCFINSTYDDCIYRIDGYGNLDNVTPDFLSNLCYDLTEIINKEIKSLDQDDEL